MSRLFFLIAIVSLAQGQFYPGYPQGPQIYPQNFQRYPQGFQGYPQGFQGYPQGFQGYPQRYPYMPYLYNPRPQLPPVYQPYQQNLRYPPMQVIPNIEPKSTTSAPTATQKTVVSTAKYLPCTKGSTRPCYSTTIKPILTTTSKPTATVPTNPVFQFNRGDVIDYEYVYDTMPDERYRAGYIMPIQITTVDKKVIPKKNVIRHQDVNTYSNVQTSRPNPVRETVTETSIYISHPSTTLKVNTVPTTTSSTYVPVFTTKKPPVFKPPSWETREEALDKEEEEEDTSSYDEDYDDDHLEETTTQATEETTKAKSWWG